MAWRRDPATGEWEMVDAPSATPIADTRMDDQGPHEGMGMLPGAQYPMLPSDQMPSRTNEGAPEYQGAQMIPSADPGDRSGHYDNEDTGAQTAWVEAAKDRGNIVRFTADGVFEIDPNTRQVVGQRPPMPRMN